MKKTIMDGNDLAMVMLAYGTPQKLSFEKELGDLVGFFKKRGFSDAMFGKSEIHGPQRKFGRTLGSYFWQGYRNSSSPFYKNKLR